MSRHGIKNPAPVQNGSRESEADVIIGHAGDQTLSNKRSLRLYSTYDSGNTYSLIEDSERFLGSLPFDNHTAKTILSEKWNKAIAGPRVTMNMSSDSETVGYPEAKSDC